MNNKTNKQTIEKNLTVVFTAYFLFAFSAIAVAFILSQYFVVLEDWKWLVIAGIIIIAGTYGDLIESLFKRSIEIKDSGSILPGHGGFMDRFDGLLLSAPFITAFLKIC